MTTKSQPESFTDEKKRKIYRVLWLGALSPIILILLLLLKQTFSDLPEVAALDNPPELLASVIYADDGTTELGKYWKVNRSSVPYKEISPYVIDALIATEDERFLEHSGVDFKGLGRAVVKLGTAGGASTITQQLAKLLFTLQKREEEDAARAAGEDVPIRSRGIIGRVDEKAQENIIAARLEKRFTKEEIITMYLNQFDFLYNAVGIKNAAKVYFNKTPKELTKVEAACLVGMVKNPSLYNPRTYQIKNYRNSLAANKGVSANNITSAEIAEARAKDSLRMHTRRDQVLMQWLKNTEKGNAALHNKMTKEEYDKLKAMPIIVDYQPVDHKEGIAPYFREALRKELSDLFKSRDKNGNLMYKKPDGTAYNIYADGLKIYTTINPKLQKYAEEAVEEHIGGELQEAFTRNNRRQRRFPFSNTYDGKAITDEQIERIMRRGRRGSERFIAMKSAGASDQQVKKAFETPTAMTIFSWKGDIDTIMTPNDSIRYYKNFLHAGLITIEPQTGFVKAWVGGTDITHFSYDHVRQGTRQVGSTIKPFVYGTALAMGTCQPNTTFSGSCCIGNWCPRGSAAGSMTQGLVTSSNPTTVHVMKSMGPISGPQTIAKILKDVDINLPPDQITPPMCLGPMDLSLIQLIGAQAMWVNHGIYNRPTTIMRIEDRNGNVIFSAEGYSKEVMNATVAYEIIKMMKGVVDSGTGQRLRRGYKYGNITAPTAGKTGTTQSNSDGWFVGLTPQLATGVWVGAEDKQVRFSSTGIGQGAAVALPIYGYYMNKVYADKSLGIKQDDFEEPPGYAEENFHQTVGISEDDRPDLFND